ncbi:MAG: hypothetical protein ACE15B_10875 [Bryobacteraceae bacterium]
MQDARIELLSAPARWELKTLRALFTPEAKALGYSVRKGEYAFLTVAEGEVRRSLVLLDMQPRALVAFDLGAKGKLEVLGAKADEPLESLDLAGVRIANRAVLFRTEATMARDAVSYVVEGGGKLKHLITGLAPGDWSIWWNGWLEDPGVFVEPSAGCLYFEGNAGSYFLRRVSR